MKTTDIAKQAELKELWMKEESENFTGWDFTKLNEKIIDEPLPWSYKDIVLKYLKSNYQLLDMGTGGGELLLTLNHPYQNTSITEAYEPNYKLCTKTLKPLGIGVHFLENDNKLPFDDHKFDLIINRHEAYNTDEVFRILKPGGFFITQQVGPMNNQSLSRFLLSDPSFKLCFDCGFDKDLERLSQSGFEIVSNLEYYPESKFLDTGALVQFAKIIEWEFPNFSVAKCFDQLLEIHDIICKEGFYTSSQHRYLIVAHKIK